MALLCLPLASAAGRLGADGQGGTAEIVAAGVGMQDLTPMPLVALVGTPVTSSTSPLTYQMNQAADNTAPTGTQLSLPPGFTTGWSDANAVWFVRPDQTTTIRNSNTIEGTDPSQPISTTNPGVYRLPTGQWVGSVKNDQRGVAAQILSLYSITQTTSAGYQTARSNISGTAAEQDVKAQYLFKSIFGSVLIGNSANQYANIRYVLGKLGVQSAPAAHHHHHFHITMAVPTVKTITANTNLTTGDTTGDANMIDIGTEVNDAILLAQANPPAIVVSQPNWLSRSIKDPIFLKEAVDSINSGQVADLSTISYQESGPLGVPSLKVPLTLEFSPGDSLENNRQHLELARTACIFLDARIRQAGAWGPECKIEEVVSLPKGKLTEDTSSMDRPGTFWYDPVGLGHDQFRFILVNGAGKKVDVTFVFNVKRAPDDQGQADQDVYRITSLTGDLDAWFASVQLSTLLGRAASALNGYSDLAGSAVANTTGEGLDASILLDTAAAGHGWYIDPTPLDNTDDYLPTSNPNVWQAKAGTDAAGKMDLLSVLLHEYGHALGLEHSSESGDYMAATLQPGQRRLPSAEELQLMSELVAQLKVGDGGEQTPNAPVTPSPLAPSVPLGALLLGRLTLGRRSEDATEGSQALFAAHPTLQGGGLQNLQDWATQGQVAVASGGAGTGGATLQEGAASQTRLNQVFMVGPNDRYRGLP